ncbi:hypothetical protein, partial [Enterococcus faecalis]|uniref:hypothetical protein n=1 Tax=Enterococcus faecalis TaxID=1351 RepID=UPI001AD7AD03
MYKMFCEGKEVTVKTKNKDYATLIDLQEAPICALKVNKNGIITGAYAAIAGQPYTTKSYSYNYIEKVDFDKSLTGYTFSGGQKAYNNASYQLADDCKIYNVSNNFKSHRGEKTTIKAGDRIQALYSYDTKKITHVWVMSRMVDTPLYSNPYPQNSSSGTKRTPDADGYYSVQLFVVT